MKAREASRWQVVAVGAWGIGNGIRGRRSLVKYIDSIMHAPRFEPDNKPVPGRHVPSASPADKWAEPDGPAPPPPKNRIVRTGLIICACGFAIAIVGVWRLAEMKNYATFADHFTHKTGLLTMFTGFVTLLIGFRGSRFGSRTTSSARRHPIGDAMLHPHDSDWRDTPWRTS